MKAIPAIDIKDGKCVQLIGGDPERERFTGDPIEAAERWIEQGADLIHVVNLDGAFTGKSSNEEVLRSVLNLADEAQVGGGIRRVEDARHLIDLGADRVIVGTKAMEKGFIRDLADDVGSDRVIVALDSRDGEVVVDGWTRGSGVDAKMLAKELEPYVWGFLYTDVDREGKMGGVAAEATKRVVDAVEAPVIASGGVSTLDDVRLLRETGAWGVVIGSALYEGAFTYKEAEEAAQ